MKFLAFVILTFLCVSPVSAGFLTGHCGNSYFSENVSSDAHVSFAVYDNTGGSGNWATDLGITPSNATGTSDRYVYFYQVVNSKLHSGTDDDLSRFQIDLSDGGVANSAGFVADTVFSDGMQVGLGGNFGLGVDGSLANPLQTGSLPSFINADDNASVAAAVEPNTATITPSNKVVFRFRNALTSSPLMFSSIMYFTSSQSPGFGTGSVNLPRNSGMVALAVPLPSAIAMAITGIPAFLVFRRSRKALRQESLSS